MSDEAQLSRLRRAADENHIKFRLQTEEWPSSHRSSFQLIRDVEKHDFVSYQASIGRDSGVSWWKEKTLLRAKWLANEAGRRSLAGANEMSWRLSIENLILQRFLFEVAW